MGYWGFREFFVFFDHVNKILEFRKFAWASLSGLDGHGKKNDGDKLECFGNIAGIGDGEGYSRTPVLIEAAFVKDFVGGSFKSTDTQSFRLRACGPNANGRFTRMNIDIPDISMTPTLKAVFEVVAMMTV